ncbi:MAG: site-2 protease family protein [Chloroflexi bacterium]|nr:site-2 protease family protein [Chloroflexota bacterium]
MFGIRLGRIAGIDISVDYTLLLIGYFIVTVVNDMLTTRLGSTSPATNLMLGVVAALIFFASILWHELAHALVARHYKIRVRRILLYFMGGSAEIEDEPLTASQEFFLAGVGPLSSIILGAVLWMVHLPFGGDTAIGAVLLWLGIMNLILAGFNMIPAFPLDGGRVARSIFWGMTNNHVTSTRIVSIITHGFALLLILYAMFLLTLGQVVMFIINGGFGIFLIFAARAQLQEAGRRNVLRGVPIGSLVRGAVPVKAEWSLAYAADIISLGSPISALPVMRDGQIVGVISMEILRAYPRVGWGSLRVEQVMYSMGSVQQMQANTDIYDAIKGMRNNRFVLVMNDQRPLGLLSQGDIFAYIERRLAS